MEEQQLLLTNELSLQPGFPLNLKEKKESILESPLATII